MTLRWVTSALSDAKGRFRKLRGFRDMKQLMAALTKRVAENRPAERKAASHYDRGAAISRPRSTVNGTSPGRGPDKLSVVNQTVLDRNLATPKK